MNTKKPIVSKGLIISAVLVCVLFGGAIWYMRSDVYMPAPFRGSTEEFVTNLQKQAAHRQRAGIADLEPEAERGDRDAQRKLARLYRMKSTEEGYRKAFLWAGKAAEDGSPGTTKDLAYYYECGIGTKKDVAKAIQLYTPSAKAGAVLSQYALSYLETDPKKAAHWSKLVHQALKECPSCDLPPAGCF